MHVLSGQVSRLAAPVTHFKVDMRIRTPDHSRFVQNAEALEYPADVTNVSSLGIRCVRRQFAT